jgi:biotin synthase
MAEANATFRHDWTYAEVEALYQQPFTDLILQAQSIHRSHFTPNTVQVSTLQNIKVGGCPEDCGWCGQSVYHGVPSEPLTSATEVIKAAEEAKEQGATRYCLAASWRGPTERNLNKVIEMVKGIKSLGLEACITIGKLRPEQAQALKEAGLDYYNHNLETSRDHFNKVTSTRSYDDRLNTLHHVREAGLKVCSGGILGMGETEKDRFELLLTLANQPEHPQSVPMNQLVPVPGTPLENTPPLDEFVFIRCVALARIMMPKAYVRLSGGRLKMSSLMQALCFMAGANSIHYGSRKLLVTPNVDAQNDIDLFHALGILPEGGFVGPFEKISPSPSHKTLALKVLS